MIQITHDIHVNLDAVPPDDDFVYNDMDKNKYYDLVANAIKSYPHYGKFEILKFSNSEDTFSLIRESGYWIICYSERGKAQFIAIFKGMADATNYFVEVVAHQEAVRVDLRSI